MGAGSVQRMPEALIVVDVQRGMEDPSWGPRNDPACEENVAALLDAWRRREPVIVVRHDPVTPGSPLRTVAARADLR